MNLVHMAEYLKDSTLNNALNLIDIKRSVFTLLLNDSKQIKLEALKTRFNAFSKVELKAKIEIALCEVLGYNIDTETALDAGFLDDLPRGIR